MPLAPHSVEPTCVPISKVSSQEDTEIADELSILVRRMEGWGTTREIATAECSPEDLVSSSTSDITTNLGPAPSFAQLSAAKRAPPIYAPYCSPNVIFTNTPRFRDVLVFYDNVSDRNQLVKAN